MEKKKKFFKFSFFCRFFFKTEFNNNSLLILETYKWGFYQLFLFLKKKKCIYNNRRNFDSHIVLYLEKKNIEYKKKNLIYIKINFFSKKNCLKFKTNQNYQKNLFILTKLRIFFYFLCKKIIFYHLNN